MIKEDTISHIFIPRFTIKDKKNDDKTDFLGGSVVKTPQCRGPPVQFLVRKLEFKSPRELGPKCHNQRACMLDATSTWKSQINKVLKNDDRK